MHRHSAWHIRRAVLALLLTTASLLWAGGGSDPEPIHMGDAGPAPTKSTVTRSVEQAAAAYHLPPDKLKKAEALYKTHTVLYLIELVMGIVVLWAIVRLRIAPRYRDIAERVSGKRFVQALIFVPLLFLTLAVISLPLGLYHHHLSRAYGLSVQAWGSWAWDWCKEQIVSLIILVPVVYGLFATIRRSPQRWWFYFWLLTMPFVILMVFVAPVLLDPLFNKFEPLDKTQPALVAPLQAVAHRGGLAIPESRMFEMKASEKVTTYNAYVTGIGATKRVVVWDNTARQMTVPETQFVFGHELGHYVLNHIYKGLAFSAVLMFVGFWLGRTVVLAMLARWGESWSIRGLNDYAALPVLMLTLTLFSLASDPITNEFSRYIEHQADIYGLEVTHGLTPDSRDAAVTAFQKLGEKSLDYPYPSPLFVFFTYDHPPVSDRMRFASSYAPWDKGEPTKYVK